MWSTSLSTEMHQEYTFRHGSSHRTPAKSEKKSMTTGKEYIDPHKTWSDKGRRRKRVELAGLDLHLGGGGTEAGVRYPHRGNCLGQRRSV